jgi:hypothetical protein
MSIKIIQVEINEKNEGFDDPRRLEIEDIIDNDSFFYPTTDTIRIFNDSTLNYIRKISLNELCIYFESIIYYYKPIWSTWNYLIDLSLRDKNFYEHKDGTIYEEVEKAVYFEVYFDIDYKMWNFPFSVSDLEREVINLIAAKEYNLVFLAESMEIDKFGFRFNFTEKKHYKLKDIEREVLEIVESLHLEALKLLQERNTSDLLTTLFEFPEEIKTSCKQYLIYFAQFLADMGINATTSIKEDANKVLFTITPEDETIALSKIQEALTLYLDPPTFENIGDENLNKDIAVLQWQSNIYHLKSQLALSQALLQTKDATIEALQLSNYQLKQVIGTADGKPKLEDSKKEEEIIKGVMAVKKYDGKFFSVDLPEIIRKLKRKLGK